MLKETVFVAIISASSEGIMCVLAHAGGCVNQRFTHLTRVKTDLSGVSGVNGYNINLRRGKAKCCFNQHIDPRMPFI